MRKLILASALATTLIPVVASAQSYGEVRQDQREFAVHQSHPRGSSFHS